MGYRSLENTFRCKYEQEGFLCIHFTSSGLPNSLPRTATMAQRDGQFWVNGGHRHAMRRVDGAGKSECGILKAENRSEGGGELKILHFKCCYRKHLPINLL